MEIKIEYINARLEAIAKKKEALIGQLNGLFGAEAELVEMKKVIEKEQSDERTETEND